MVQDEIIIAISGIATGIITAIVTVWREHIKDIKERYEERADLYKKEHFTKLREIIKNEIDRETQLITDIDDGDLKGVYGIQTPGVKIMYNYNKVKVEAYQPFIQNENLFSHIKEGYKELYLLIQEAIKQEKGYKDLVCKTINNMMNQLNEIHNIINNIIDVENVYVPTLLVRKLKISTNNYYKSNIINYIIDNVDFQKDCNVTDDGIICADEERMILTFSDGRIDERDINKFLNICIQIKNEHLEEIKKIETMNTQIDEIYKGMCDKFREIINDLKAGQRLGGTCEICKKIDDAQSKQSLMPFS